MLERQAERKNGEMMRNALFQEICIRVNSKNARYRQNASKNVRHLKELWTFRKMFVANSSEYDLLDSPKWPSVLSEDAILFAAVTTGAQLNWPPFRLSQILARSCRIAFHHFT